MQLAAALESLQKLILPDRWQAQAIHALREGRDVVVSAPTGAGKTYIFERWAEQSGFSRRALFTVPTRALANDKYAEWRARGWRVGIVTGDLSVDPDAPVVVATLEAVQGILSLAVVEEAAGRPRASSRRSDAEFRLLVVDEYHWIADPARGNHYEGVLMAAPPGLQLLLLSGAVSNPEDVAVWLRRLGREAEVVLTRERPVPLEEIDVDDLVGGLPRVIEGFWSRRVAGALRAGYGPVLVFAPHRQDAERLAKQFARELPLPDPLTLTPEQEQACGPVLARLLRARVAYHHSGLTYAQRAGAIEPLAKAGQLRAVVATLGLSAGINFSLRSVMITAGGYRFDQLEREIEPHEILQMTGRAGRRGLDEAGFVLSSGSAPRLRSAAPLRLRRSVPLPWAILLRQLLAGRDAAGLSAWASPRFYAPEPLAMGDEATRGLEPSALPCNQKTDTGRARLVRRRRDPFRGCRGCALREACLALPTTPTPLWLWQRLGILDRDLRLSARGEIASFFLGPEGLALAAALDDPRHPLEDLVFELANLFAGDRFSGTNPRRTGRLARVCEKAFRELDAEGYLDRGLPPQYGCGAAEIVHGLEEQGEKARRVLDEHVLAGRGDVDRLLTEWRSLLRQVAGAPARLQCARGREDASLSRRWRRFRALCTERLAGMRQDVLPELPPLTPDQRRPVNHRFFKAPRPGARPPPLRTGT